MSNPWVPSQYERFADQRQQAFHDLLSGVEPVPGGLVADLGCGTGRLTRRLHRHAGGQTIGIDRSQPMLARALAAPGGDECTGDPEGGKDAERPPEFGLEFLHGDLVAFLEERISRAAGFDLLFSNAALHWIEDHPTLFARLLRALRPGGQLAVQVPTNHDSPAYRAADALAGEEPYRTALDGFIRRSPVLSAEQYSVLLDDLGFASQNVQLRVYPHRLRSRAEVFEWIAGAYLRAYEARMAPGLWGRFADELRARLDALLPQRSPFFFPFKRILIWARAAP